MMADEVKTVIGVRFTPLGKIYHFSPGEIEDIKVGDGVIVETSRGWQLGFVACLVDPSKVDGSNHLKQIDRKATPRDLIVRQSWEQKEQEVLEFSRRKIREMGYVATVKIIQAEYSFDGKRLAVFYNTEGEGGVEIKNIRRELQRRYSSTKVDLRPLGPRDVAKSICGLGACGKEVRCCCSFLTDFNSISIRMAKNQGISLTPVEITGMCGRLRCCLAYEDEHYSEIMSGMPKKGKRIRTPLGEGKVVEVRTLQEEIVVDVKDVGKKVFTKEEVKNFPKPS